ncbi:hypothetical protein [Roseomonas marmotae]|uniref:Uncharacterized protein n=1 Tax=Roseomonas marmotae TaxID=2768161 RepID=A0ABS3KL37_9PROT|nr:hypothetical protein [Roseomonas marmotae]MBO1077046.1 hypothetical protein [Roseomonas marmotae]QTI82117.1 hypothetical protein IAI58_22445 [Roseomonas marmotae]
MTSRKLRPAVKLVWPSNNVTMPQGWTSGTEKGAANYIDNLVSQRNGRFIEPWEADFLKLFFRHVRNPLGHGAGSQAPPEFTEHQIAWAIETAMSWIKSLIRRL